MFLIVLSADLVVCVCVCVCICAGEGPESGPTSFTTLCEPPSRVQNLFLEEKQSSSLRFIWDEPLLNNGTDFSYTVSMNLYTTCACGGSNARRKKSVGTHFFRSPWG